MPKKPAHGHHHPNEECCEQVFRGRKISVQEQKGKLRLLIDGDEIPFEFTGRGYIAEASMFREYGSLEELAQDLIKDWGRAKIKHSKVPNSGHHHH